MRYVGWVRQLRYGCHQWVIACDQQGNLICCEYPSDCRRLLLGWPDLDDEGWPITVVVLPENELPENGPAAAAG